MSCRRPAAELSGRCQEPCRPGPWQRSGDFLSAKMPWSSRNAARTLLHDCITAAMKLSSMTSGEVITLLFGSLPTASRRLGDAELLRGYLTLIHQLSATAARGLRPMLGHIDELLSKLTLSGLRRWANFGAQAYRRDYHNLTSYFNLKPRTACRAAERTAWHAVYRYPAQTEFLFACPVGA